MLGARTILLHAKQMLPDYTSTILWPFALKYTEDQMNKLVHRADGQTPYQALTGLDPIKLDVSNFHTFGCPCYVLDHRLQPGNSMVPKMGATSMNGLVRWTFTLTCCKHCFDSQSMYRTCITTISCRFWQWLYYSSLLALISGPTILGWFGLRFHKIACIYQKSSWHLAITSWTYSKIGDFTSEQTEIPNIDLGTSTNIASASSLESCEGVLDASMSEHTSMLQLFSFQDQNASGNNNPQPNK